MKKLISIILIFSYSLAYAGVDDCGMPVQHLNKGDSAPCEGYLFSQTKELEVRLAKEQISMLQQEMDIKNKQLVIYLADISIFRDIHDKQQQETELWRKAAVDSTEKLVSSDNGRGTRDFLFFLGGIVTLYLGSLAVRNVR